MEKSIHKLKAELCVCACVCVCVCVCVRVRKELTALISLLSFLRHKRNVNLLFKIDLQSAELLTKTSFFLYFRDCPEMAKEVHETSKV